MADFVGALAQLRTRLQDFTALPLFWPNDDRSPGPENAPNGFVFSEAQLLNEGPITLGVNGTRTHRDEGEFSIYVYGPRGTRVGQVEQWASDIRNLFQLTTLTDVIITSRVIGAGQVADSDFGKYYVVPIRIEFFSDRQE